MALTNLINDAIAHMDDLLRERFRPVVSLKLRLVLQREQQRLIRLRREQERFVKPKPNECNDGL
jgi:hypothetical protein